MLYMSFDFGTALIDDSLNLQHIDGFVLAADSALVPIPSHQKAHFFLDEEFLLLLQFSLLKEQKFSL